MIRPFKLTRLAILCLILALQPMVGRGQEVLDGLAAVVNGDVITFSQVRELVGMREKALRESLKGQELVEKIKELRLAALNDLIDRQLVIQEFKKNQFTIPPHVIDERVQAIIREEFGGDRQAFSRTLEAQGYTLAKFKAAEEEKIIVQAMRQRNAGREPVIPPQKVEQFYKNNLKTYTTPEQVKLRMIVLKKGEGDSPLKMAEEIRTKAIEGAEFDKLAQMYSEDSSKENGGDWGWIERNTLNEELTRVAFGLKPGMISKTLPIGDNLYILYVEARNNAKTRPLNDVRSEIDKKLMQEARQKSQEKWIAGLRAKAYIKTF